MSNADIVTLRVRVIAREKLLVSLLATASNEQLELAREMAGYISPRPGFTVSAVAAPPFAGGHEPRCSEPLKASTHDDFRAYA
jgi:hypothetical protein